MSAVGHIPPLRVVENTRPPLPILDADRRLMIIGAVALIGQALEAWRNGNREACTGLCSSLQRVSHYELLPAWKLRENAVGYALRLYGITGSPGAGAAGALEGWWRAATDRLGEAM